MRTLTISLLLFVGLLVIPFVANADEFVPLAPIPNLSTGSGDSLSDYVNSAFFLVISLAAMVAVIRIVIGGFQYMTTEALSAKDEARRTIQGAIFGLLLLLGSYLILGVINPQILDLESLNFSNLAPSASTQAQIQQDIQDTQARLAAIQEQAAAFGDPANFSEPGDATGQSVNFAEPVDDTSVERNAYQAACRSGGGEFTVGTLRICRNSQTGGETRVFGTRISVIGACSSRGEDFVEDRRGYQCSR